MNEKLNLSPEEELAILEEGVKSQFWAIYARWQGQASLTAIGSALSQKVADRDWMAGRANGLKEALNYPSTRMRQLKTLIEQKKKADKKTDA